MPKQCKLLPDTPARVRLEKALDEAEIKAHRNLGLYNFHNFGYWAVIWVHLNRAGGFNRPNPFTDYVKLAQKRGGIADAKRKPGHKAQEVPAAQG